MVRLGSAGSVWVSVALWALAIAFLLDFWMRMGRLERGILLLAVLAVGLWTLARHLLPALRVREGDVALALLVERQQGLSSDLVGALQFADAGRAQYGSDVLREAVVDCTAEASASLDFLEGFSRERLLRRAATLAVTAVVVILPAVAFPRHAAVFLKRLFLLAGTHYPTRTIIERIESPAGGTAAYGQPVVFKVRAAGEIPPAGRVELQALASDLTTAIELTPEPNDPNLFVGRLHRVLDDLSYTVYLGDAYTEPRELRLIPLPLVTVSLDVTPPAYAAAKFRRDSEGGRQAVAPEGSRVALRVSADKALASGSVTVGKVSYPLTPKAGQLVLDPSGTVFEKVVEPMRFKVQVVDVDGLSLERPISGTVQVTPDRPPRIAAAAKYRHVLPTATPRVLYRAVDDYGISRIVLHRTVSHADDPNETQSSATIEVFAGRPIRIPPRDGASPLEHALGLGALKLLKGDRVTIVLEAVDYRGDSPGRGGSSDPITFLVTDKQGLLQAMGKLDDRMIEKLDEIIRAQLGIGE
jgi:hypothetical protein